jgi:uracil-DNA glycosylase family 4
MSQQLDLLSEEIASCRACPRLVAWREKVAREKRAAFQDEEYWGRPVPGYGDPDARILVVGLAPAAHGGNRTGRVFTGDRSGDWLFASMFRQGLTNQPHSVHRDDGLELHDSYIAAAVRCVPPDNKPAIDERDRCLPYLVREARLLSRLSVVVALGGFAWDAWLRTARALGHETPRPKPRFAHRAEATAGPHTLLGSYHPSQQNTFTGRLTEQMLDDVFARARTLAGLSKVRPPGR